MFGRKRAQFAHDFKSVLLSQICESCNIQKFALQFPQFFLPSSSLIRLKKLQRNIQEICKLSRCKRDN